MTKIGNQTYSGSFSFSLDLRDEDDFQTAHQLQTLLTGHRITLNGEPAILEGRR